MAQKITISWIWTQDLWLHCPLLYQPYKPNLHIFGAKVKAILANWFWRLDEALFGEMTKVAEQSTKKQQI